MKKLKICFDTSTISSLYDNSANTAPSISLFKLFQQTPNRFDLILSPAFYIEIYKAPKWILNEVHKITSKLKFSKMPESIEAGTLAKLYVEKGVLSEKHFVDLLHIAYSSIFCCNYFISCDKTHIVRERTIKYIQNINSGQNIFVPEIITPSTFLEIQNE
jgi:hypothetical protein